MPSDFEYSSMLKTILIQVSKDIQSNAPKFVLTLFKGQISRKTYWLSIISLFLFVIIFAIALNFVIVFLAADADDASNILGASKILGAFFGLFVVISFSALQVKRCHDIGLTGWLALLSCVPVVQWFWWFLLGVVTDKNIDEAAKFGARFGKKADEHLKRKEEEKKAKEEILKCVKEVEDEILISGNSQEKLIVLERRNKMNEKKILPAFLLCLFFGPLGFHRFYAGKIGTGILQLFTLGGLGIWVLIDFITIIVGAFTDKEGNKITQWT